MVIVFVPVEAVKLLVSVKVVFVDNAAGPKDAVVPVGRPLTEKSTTPENPEIGVTVTVEVVFPPWVIVTVFGLADKLKDEELVVPIILRCILSLYTLFSE